MEELPSHVTDTEISDSIKNETSEFQEISANESLLIPSTKSSVNDCQVSTIIKTENNFVNDFDTELISTIEIEEHNIKLEVNSAEDTEMEKLPTQVKDSEISESIKSQDKSPEQEMSATYSFNPYLCVKCWNCFSIESVYNNHKINCQRILQYHITDPTSHILTDSVDGGETIKEEIKNEVKDEYQIDPLLLSQFV